jgi:hypothetical protein
VDELKRRMEPWRLPCGKRRDSIQFRTRRVCLGGRYLVGEPRKSGPLQGGVVVGREVVEATDFMPEVEQSSSAVARSVSDRGRAPAWRRLTVSSRCRESRLFPRFIGRQVGVYERDQLADARLCEAVFTAGMSPFEFGDSLLEHAQVGVRFLVILETCNHSISSTRPFRTLGSRVRLKKSTPAARLS